MPQLGSKNYPSAWLYAEGDFLIFIRYELSSFTTSWEKDHGFLKFYYLTKKYKHITVGRINCNIKPTDSEVNHKNIFLSIF